MSVTESANAPDSATATRLPPAASHGIQPSAAVKTRAPTPSPVVSFTAERVRRNAPVKASTTQSAANVVARPGGRVSGSPPSLLSPSPTTRSAASAIGKPRLSHDLYQSRRRRASAAAENVIQPSAAARLPMVGGGIGEILLRKSLPRTKIENAAAATPRKYARFNSARRASSSRLFSIVALS